MSEYPQFYKINQINKDQDTFSVVSGLGTVENCFDYDSTTEWESIGSDDSTTETITALFKAADDSEENRSINRVILTGFNGKDFRIYTAYWNGAAYDAWVLQDTVTSSTIENHIRSFTAVSCGSIKIEIDNTIVAAQEKTITQFIATQLIWEATMPMDAFSIKNKQDADIRRLYNGKGQKILHYDKWATSIEFRQITQIERNALRDIYDNYNTFIIMPEPYTYLAVYDKPEEFYRVFFQSAWDQQYATTIKTAGYSIKMNLEEV